MISNEIRTPGFKICTDEFNRRSPNSAILIEFLNLSRATQPRKSTHFRTPNDRRNRRNRRVRCTVLIRCATELAL